MLFLSCFHPSVNRINISTTFWHENIYEVLQWASVIFWWNRHFNIVLLYTRHCLVLYDAIHLILKFVVSVNPKWLSISESWAICDVTYESRRHTTRAVLIVLFSTAPIAAFRKRDKQEKDDITQERLPQGWSWFVLFILIYWQNWIWKQSISSYQMSHCPDRALKHKRLKTSWTSTGTSRGPVLVMEPQLELLMMAQEVRMKCLLVCILEILVAVVKYSHFLFRSMCWGECAWVSKRRRSSEYFYRRPPGLSQPDSSAAWLQVFFQVRNVNSP